MGGAGSYTTHRSKRKTSRGATPDLKLFSVLEKRKPPVSKELSLRQANATFPGFHLPSNRKLGNALGAWWLQPLH